jgi:hypothetical protein
MGQASICFWLASFSLYLPRFYHFAFRIKRAKSKPKSSTPPPEQIKPASVQIVCARDTKTMATFANPELDAFDVRAVIAKWSLKVQAGEDKNVISALDSIRSIATRAFEEIFKLAEKGNKSAVEILHNFFDYYLSEFERFCDKRPEIFEPIARTKVRWPGFISKQTGIKKRNEKLIAKIHLAEDQKRLDCRRWN